MIFQDFRMNAMQAYIKYRAYDDKKAISSKLRRQQYMLVLQPEADIQRCKILATKIHLIGPFIVRRALPNHNYLTAVSERTEDNYFIA